MIFWSTPTGNVRIGAVQSDVDLTRSLTPPTTITISLTDPEKAAIFNRLFEKHARISKATITESAGGQIFILGNLVATGEKFDFATSPPQQTVVWVVFKIGTYRRTCTAPGCTP